jgi:isopenicillin N synthase-like dioxygenase
MYRSHSAYGKPLIAMPYALALQLPCDIFASTIVDYDLCTLRCLHYPPCTDVYEEASKKNATVSRIGEHTDFGAFTFLFWGDQGAEGLPIQPVEGGEVMVSKKDDEDDDWLDVVVSPHSTIVNTGAMMARRTNGRPLPIESLSNPWNRPVQRSLFDSRRPRDPSQRIVCCTLG